MEVIIEFPDEYDLTYTLENISNRKDFQDVKINRIATKKVLVIYPDSYSLIQIRYLFGAHRRLKIYSNYYLVTFSSIKDISIFTSEIGMKFPVFFQTNNTLIVDNTIQNMEYIEFRDLLEEMRVILDDVVIIPYKFQENDYIKLNYNFSSIYYSGILSDLEFHVKDKVFKVHRIIIIAASNYFMSFLTQYYPNKNIIQIDDIEPELFEKILKVIYGY